MRDRRSIKGSVSPRGARWLAQLPPSLGRRGRLVDTEDEGWEWLEMEQARAKLGLPMSSTKTAGTVETLMETWLTARTENVKASTLVGNRRHARTHVYGQPLGRMPIEAVRGMDIDACLAATPPNWTRDQVAKVLRGFFDWAENNSLTKNGNPYRQSSAKQICKTVRRTVAKRVEAGNTWTPDQIATFIASEKDAVYRDLWAFLAATGARRGEGIGLRWKAVDAAGGQCQLVDNVTVSDGLMVVNDSPKNWKPRTAYFGTAIGKMLLARNDEQTAHRSGFSRWHSDFVFDARRARRADWTPGSHLIPPTVTVRFNTLTEKLGLPALGGPHGLRRSFATISEREGFLPSVREAALGHTPDLAGMYTKASEVELRELAERMATLILPNG